LQLRWVRLGAVHPADPGRRPRVWPRLGAGAATADAFYGTLAALGLTLVSAFLIDQANWLRLIGGAYLCYLGVKTLRSLPAPSHPAQRAGDVPGEQAAEARGRGLLGAFTSTLFLTLTNPLTIFAFAAIFAGVGAEAASGNTLGALNVVLACFWVRLPGG